MFSALKINDLYVLVGFLVLGLLPYLLVKLFFRKTKLDPEEHKELYRAFDRHPIKQPTIEMQKVKWLPTFTVTFLSKPDYEYARDHGLLERFNIRIQKQFLEHGPAAELFVTYRWIDEKQKIQSAHEQANNS